MIEPGETKNGKIVIFTESKDTAKHIKENLKKDKVLLVTGDNVKRVKKKIIENFDANYKDKKDDYDIIITTDTLAEGVNLHRSNIIYNYDIPWNATKLMQRIGRVNRIGTEFDSTHYVYNFIPTATSEKYINLAKNAFIKLQTFHSTLGEDNKILTEDEEVKSLKLFQEMEEINEELKFFNELREFKKNNPKTL